MRDYLTDYVTWLCGITLIIVVVGIIGICVNGGK